MIVYTMTGFIVFRLEDEHGRRSLYGLQVALIISMHFTCFLSICLKTGDIRYLFYYAGFQVAMILFMELYPMIYPKISRLIVNHVCMLTSIGLVMLTRLDFDKAVKQAVIALVSFALGGLIPFIMKKINRIPNVPYIYGGFSMFLLLLVYFVGRISNGSRLAIYVFGLSFQASEFVKIIFVICLAGILYNGTEIKNLMIATAISAAHVLALALSNDLGAALILFVTFVLMVFIATSNFFYLLVGIGTGAGVSVLAYHLFRHVQVRVQAFIDPFSVIDNEGYQITQSLFAIGSGSWFGLGLFNGTPETIPYVETDFIYSAIAQEFGIVFAICLILICLSCFIMFINISFKLSDDFYRYIAVGLGFTYIFQVFLTVGGGTRFIPLTGVTLPLVSYGGSSVMATVFTFMLIESMYTLRETGEITFKNKAKERKLKDQYRMISGLVYLFILVFAAISVYLSVYVFTHREVMINNPYNPRQEALARQSVRGPIYSRNMEILASSSLKDDTEIRNYPFHNIFSHVVGYASNGKSGIESLANYYLINTNQPLTERLAADLAGEKYLGDGVVTTLDTELQKAAYNAIGSYNGAAVVSDPRTGEILALVSKPDFDPNEIREIWDDLINDEDSSVLLNRATNGLYPPGSTFKTVTLYEYIKEHPEDYEDYSFNCNGELRLDGGKIICYNHETHGSVSLRKSIALSCNSSFGNIGLLLDRKRFSETLKNFMFNEEMPGAFGIQSSSITMDDAMSDKDMALTAFGQGKTLMTPMHLNMISSAIANGGVVMKPYMISKVLNSRLNTVKEFEKEEYRTIMTKDEADVMTEMLGAVVEIGTAKKLKNDRYTVAGKTGSAEFSDYTTSTHSWFTGFAPAEDPQICVTIILEDAGVSGLHAVPVAKKIFDTYFERYDNE